MTTGKSNCSHMQKLTDSEWLRKITDVQHDMLSICCSTCSIKAGVLLRLNHCIHCGQK